MRDLTTIIAGWLGGLAVVAEAFGAQAGVGTDGVVIPTAAVGGDTTAIDVLIVYTVMAFSDSGGMPVPEV